MKFLSLVIAFSCICVAFVSGSDETTSATTDSTTTQVTNTTTQAGTTKQVTTTPAATTKQVTTTTPAATTKQVTTTTPAATTKKVTTTTPAATTKQVTTTSSVTTTGAVVTTPAADPKVTVKDYNVTKNGTVCLKARFGAQFIKGKRSWPVSDDAVADLENSNCSMLIVKFDHSHFTIRFEQNSKNAFYLHEVDAHLSWNSSSSLTASNHSLTEAKASNGSSYMCKSGITIGLSHDVTFKMTSVRLQPYFVEDGKFATAQSCDDDLSPIVPIIVGAILAGLVVIVIIAYFIGRNRNRAGYEEI